VGDKDGAYFVRGPFVDGHPTRADAHLQSASLLVLDGDSSLNPETGEITAGAPDPGKVHRALVALTINHCLYSTHSHDPGGRGNRYRILIPAIMRDKAELTGVLAWIFHQLAAQGCHLVNVKENRSWSQPWYLPRRATDTSPYVCLHHEGGGGLDVAAAMAWHTTEEAPLAQEVLERVTTTARPRDPDSDFARFNQQHGNPAAMLAVLQQYGYSLTSTSQINEQISYRLLSPHSTSGSAGIVLFCGDDGTWLVYSHHAAEEPLSRAGEAVRVCDAFDLCRILEHGGDENETLIHWKKTVDTRPVIRVIGGEVAPNLISTVKVLAEEYPPVIYQRAQALCRVAHLKETSETEGCSIPAGTAHIVPLQKAILTVIISEIIRWERYKKKGWQQVDPCPKVTAALLEAIGMWEGIPCLLGISEAPILRADGTLLSESGYDPASRLYVEGRTPPITLPETVTREQAREAAKRLLVPFEEFPFVDAELDPAVVLALLFTLALRPQVPTAPLVCVSATSPGSGKGLLVEAANLLVRGRDAATMPPIQGRGGEEETRKRITALLSQGISAINMDNWTRPIGGESMNALLTTTEWTDRILARSVTVTLPNCSTMIATGNNLSVKGDMTRRSLVIQLDAGVERPELRTFKERDLPGRILRDRGDLLRDLFTVLKGYQQAGYPDRNKKPLGRFEKWTAAVCGPIRWLGYPDPLDSQERLRDLDPESEKCGALLAAWWDQLGTAWFTVGEVIAAMEAQVDVSHKRVHRETLKAAVVDAAGDGRGQVSSKLLGWYLKHVEGRVVDVYKLERRSRSDTKSKHAQQYRVINISLLDGKK
jgi:hypothetical protein